MHRSRVTLIDRSPSRAIGLSYLLEGLGIQAEAFQSVSEFLETRPASPLVLVHDEDGLRQDFLAAMAHENCRYPHVVYSEEPDRLQTVRSYRDGAKSYLVFPDQLDEVPDLLARAESMLASAKEELEGGRQMTFQAGLESLTRRERQVLREVIAGRTSRQIGFELGISSRTVETHRANLMKKVRARNGPELVRIAVDADFN